MGLLAQVEDRFYQKLQTKIETIEETPADWIEKHFYIPDPRDPVTAEFLPRGPAILSEHQKRIINEALSRNPDGTLKYNTVVYSAPKKSGKSLLSAAVTLYFAWHRPDSFVYCLANDGKQSSDRIYGPIYTCFRLHRELGGIFANEKPNLSEVTLSNNTKIEAIPCDAAGEAGSQPLLSTFSEIWGWTQDSKKKLWTEMSIPPTLYGHAMQWVESYAGFTGQSEILEQLYDVGVKQAEPHPDFLDLKSDRSYHPSGAVVFVNEKVKQFTYWDHEARQAWQNPIYYAQEEGKYVPAEFNRIHHNEWSSPLDVFIQPELWEACAKDLGPIKDLKTPVVLALDGAISNDFATIVGVTRDPDDNEDVAVRFCYIFTPQQGGGRINISETVEPKLRELVKKYNVVCVAYDKHQLEDMAQRIRKEKLVWMYDFSQMGERAVADRELQLKIIDRRIYWDINGPGLPSNGELPSLYKHITQAGAKKDGERKLRLEKLSDSAKIDAAVALSMATHRCMALNIRNRENGR